MYFALFFAILSTQTFGIVISPNYTDTTHTIAGIVYCLAVLTAWICAYNAQEKYDNYETEIIHLEDEIDELKKEIKNLKKNMDMDMKGN